MTSTTSYRLSGVALLIGGILTAIGYSLPPYLSDNDPSALTSPWALISSLITLFGSLLVLLGLPGIYTRQAGRAGILGLLGFLSVWYVILLSGVIQSFISVTIVQELATNPATRLLAATPPPAFRPFFLVALLAQTLGILVLAIATLRAAVFPRWSAWMLIASLVVVLIGFLPFYPPFLQNLAPVIGNLALAGFGYALLPPQRRESTQDVPAGAGAEARA